MLLVIFNVSIHRRKQLLVWNAKIYHFPSSFMRPEKSFQKYKYPMILKNFLQSKSEFKSVFSSSKLKFLSLVQEYDKKYLNDFLLTIPNNFYRISTQCTFKKQYSFDTPPNYVETVWAEPSLRPRSPPGPSPDPEK